jgi:hypothetical protein
MRMHEICTMDGVSVPNLSLGILRTRLTGLRNHPRVFSTKSPSHLSIYILLHPHPYLSYLLPQDMPLQRV